MTCRPVSRERAKYDISWSKQTALINTFKTSFSEEMLKKQDEKVFPPNTSVSFSSHATIYFLVFTLGSAFS